MRKNKLLPIVILSLVMLGGFNGCSSKKSKEIKVGAILPLTGNLSFIGESERNGLQLAEEFVNSHYNKKLKLIIEDSKSSVKDGVSAANKLISVDKVNFIIASLTPVCKAVAPIALKNKKLEIAQSTDPILPEQYENVFRVYQSNAEEAEILVSFAVKRNFKKIAILYINNEFGRTATTYFEKLFKENGGTIVDKETYSFGQKDFRPFLGKLKNLDVDALLIYSYGNLYPIFMRQYREMGIRYPILSNMSFVNPVVKKIPPELLKNIYFTPPRFAVKSLRTTSENDFIDLYKRRFGKTPDYNAAYAYDALWILSEAINRTQNPSDWEEVKKTLLGIRKFKGMSGIITILPSGDVRTELVVCTFNKNGEIVPVEK